MLQKETDIMEVITKSHTRVFWTYIEERNEIWPVTVNSVGKRSGQKRTRKE